MGTQTPTDPLLLIGDDGSADADVAWLWVCNHAWPDWRAELVTATDPPFPPPSWGHHAELVEWDSPYGRKLVPTSQLASVRTLTVAQDRRIALGARTDADLVVVGPGRIGHSHAPVLGSTTDWLVHYPSSPTAIIRSATPTTRVLACADGSPHSLAAIEAFTRMPWASATQVTVLTIDEGHSTTTQNAEDAADIIRAAGADATVSIAKGKPTREILRHIDEDGPQLVVIGTRGLTGWKRLRVGSTAGHLLRSARCNTLVACADEPED